MPLVTLTCSPDFYPADTPLLRDGHLPSTSAMHVIELSRDLPALIKHRVHELHLDDGTPEEAVQVDIKKFHAYAVNTVDVWVEIRLTETVDDEKIRKEIADVLADMLEYWFGQYMTVPGSWALDVFYGPAHGCYTNKQRQIIQRW